MSTIQYIRFPGNNVTGSFTTSGLKNGGRVSEVTLSAASWTALPATPLANRNAICIFNVAGVEIKLNYDNSIVGYIGVPLAIDNQRFYDITDGIVIYAKAASGTPTITVEELS